MTTAVHVRSAVDRLAPYIDKAMNALDAASRNARLESGLLDLVPARASQRNGCAYGIDTHGAMTGLAEAPVGDETLARAAEQFTEVELAELIWSITVLNAWNGLGATARPWPLS